MMKGCPCQWKAVCHLWICDEIRTLIHFHMWLKICHRSEFLKCNLCLNSDVTYIRIHCDRDIGLGQISHKYVLVGASGDVLQQQTWKMAAMVTVWQQQEFRSYIGLGRNSNTGNIIVCLHCRIRRLKTFPPMHVCSRLLLHVQFHQGENCSHCSLL